MYRAKATFHLTALNKTFVKGEEFDGQIPETEKHLFDYIEPQAPELPPGVEIYEPPNATIVRTDMTIEPPKPEEPQANEPPNAMGVMESGIETSKPTETKRRGRPKATTEEN